MAFNLFMKRQYRIRKNEEFSSIIGNKKSVSDACFVLYFEDKKEDYARIGVSVSKKLGNAVVRNKIKRQVKEMAKQLVDFDNYPKDLIIIVRKAYLDKDFIYNFYSCIYLKHSDKIYYKYHRLLLKNIKLV